MKLEVGKKYFRSDFNKHFNTKWIKVTYIGKRYFFAENEDGEENIWVINSQMGDWLPYEEPEERVSENKCKHNDNVFVFYPQDVWHESNGIIKGPVNHGALIKCCHGCGKVWFEDYAQ